MTTTVTLLAGSLHYPPELVLHTASSGRIAALDELYLVIARGGSTVGFGEIRENVSYLTGLEPAAVRAAVTALVQALDWSRSCAEIREQLAYLGEATAAIARALVDIALVDWAAREKDMPAAKLLSGSFRPHRATNQSLFLSGDAEFLAMAERYVARGFHELKVRVGAGPVAADDRRLALLRETFGDRITLAIDANGAWKPDEAIDNLRALARFDLAYAEQPIAPGNWNAIERVAMSVPMPVMLDEGVATAADIDRIIAARGRLWAHLKLIKLGGMTPTVEAARKFADAAVPFMVGQMNEGAAATAAAFHCAVATQAAHAELYGADGLLDDPVCGVTYANGEVHVGRAPGLGVTLDTSALRTLWEIRA